MRSEFDRLKRKIIRQVFLAAGITVVAAVAVQVIFIDGIFQDPFARGFVAFMENTFRISNDAAVSVYQLVFRNNKVLFGAIGFVALLLWVFYLTLSKFTRYFDEIRTGMDKLVEETDGEIKLSPEMNFMEDKMNQIKGTLKKRTQDAKQAEQRKNEMVVYLAHDIRTPLTSVMGYLELMEDLPDMPKEQRMKYIGITLEKAEHLEKLINEFFEITRFNLQSMALNKSKINLSYMLAQLCDEFYPMLESNGQSTHLQADEGLYVMGDGEKLARVFNNLLKNAISYGDRNSVIEIGAHKIEKEVVITFKNSGRQVPESELENIFEKFYRLDEARSSGTGNAGLGLAIAKEIVKAHEGKISAKSSPDFTIFGVTLPSA